MDPERWRRVEQLYQSVLEVEPDRRSTFLDHHCDGDRDLRQEVESLLSFKTGAQDFMETPAFQMAARKMALEQTSENRSNLQSGSVVGHFRITQRLGAGGMGVVYQANDLKLERKVALKFLPDRSADDPAALERFRREARAASTLNHPNICTIYEIDEHQGRLFIAMELLEGTSLNRVIAADSLQVERILDISTDIADALAAAHASGIVHRDIKPSNVFVTNDARVKVLDFGLAKRLSSSDDSTVISTAGPLTAPGVPLGTYLYMSPEQALGKELDARSDLFSFGATVYEIGHRDSTVSRQNYGRNLRWDIAPRRYSAYSIESRYSP